MAVTEEMYSVTSRLALNIGTSQTGKELTKNLSIGALNTSAYEAQKVYNIAVALSECLTNSVRRIESVKTLTLTGD